MPGLCWVRGTQTHRQGYKTRFTGKETEVQRDLLTCCRLWLTCQEIAFGWHSNAKSVHPSPVLPVTTPAPYVRSRACKEPGQMELALPSRSSPGLL